MSIWVNTDKYKTLNYRDLEGNQHTYTLYDYTFFKLYQKKDKTFAGFFLVDVDIYENLRDGLLEKSFLLQLPANEYKCKYAKCISSHLLDESDQWILLFKVLPPSDISKNQQFVIVTDKCFYIEKEF